MIQPNGNPRNAPIAGESHSYQRVVLKWMGAAGIAFALGLFTGVPRLLAGATTQASKPVVQAEAKGGKLRFFIKGPIRLSAHKDGLIEFPLKGASTPTLAPSSVHIVHDGGGRSVVHVSFMFLGKEDPNRRVKVTVTLLGTGHRFTQLCSDQRIRVEHEPPIIESARALLSRANDVVWRVQTEWLKEAKGIEVVFEEVSLPGTHATTQASKPVVQAEAKGGKLRFVIKGPIRLSAHKYGMVSFPLKGASTPTLAPRSVKVFWDEYRPFVGVEFGFLGKEDPDRRVKVTVTLLGTGHSITQLCSDERIRARHPIHLTIAGHRSGYNRVQWFVHTEWLKSAKGIEVVFEELHRDPNGTQSGQVHVLAPQNRRTSASSWGKDFAANSLSAA